MEVLDNILSSYVVGANQTTVRDVLVGVGFIVVNKDGIIYSGVAGREGFDVASSPYSTDSMQWIASMTKFIMTTCILQLVGKGLVGLNEDLRPRFPELGSLPILEGFNGNGEAILVENTEPLTLHHLLTHTSGLTYDVMDPDLIRWSESINRTENSQAWSLEGFTTPLKFAPGQGWIYGTSLDWAGHVLETITNQSLEEYMKENIFTPLGMDSTAFNVSTIPNGPDRVVDWASASAEDPNLLLPGTSWIPSEYTQYSGGAGLHSTTSDYSKFLTAMLRGELLPEFMQKLVFTPQLTVTEHEKLKEAFSGDMWNFFVPEIFPAGAPVDHGLSGIINLEDSPGRRRKGSMMWSGASNGRWWVDPKSGIAAVMTTQVEPFNYPVAIELFRELEEAVYQNLV